MYSAKVAVLEPVEESRIALESVDVQASLRGLMSNVEMTQIYRNLENRAIETVYTFPLPRDAVLLETSLELNGKKLDAIVKAKSEADEIYEDAVEEGDSAILLQEVEPGIFTMNIGNLQPNERAIVRFRYAQLHHWRGDALRFHLPTTIAPRYGDPIASGLEPRQVPTYSLTANRGFTLSVQIAGELAQADFECTSHPLAVSMRDDVRTLSLSGGSAQMNQDFVLELKMPSNSTVEGLCAKDEYSNDQEIVSLATFHPMLPREAPQSPRCLKLVVDCSGSMGGTSIDQAKTALLEIISLLKPDDHFNLIRFGSTYELLFSELVTANRKNIKAATQCVDEMDANMGGTEVGRALTASYECGIVEGLPTDLLLITDGQVWNASEVIVAAQKSGHRIFTIGVGNAVSEPFVQTISEKTSGACELVPHRANMAERIVRHFNRIDQPKARSVQIEWSKEPVRQFPAEVDAVYTGDTVHVLGWFKGSPAGKAKLVASFDDDSTATDEVTFSMELSDSGDKLNILPRVAAHARLATLDGRAAAKLAEQYELVTEYTSCVLVFERAEGEKSVGIPAVRRIPQLLADGWGGGLISAQSLTTVRSRDYTPVAASLSADIGSTGSQTNRILRQKIRPIEDRHLGSDELVEWLDTLIEEMNNRHSIKVVESNKPRKNPTQMTAFDQVTSVSTWRDVKIKFVELLIAKHPEIQSELINRGFIASTEREACLLFRVPRQVVPGVWTEVHGSAATHENECLAMLSLLNIPRDEFRIDFVWKLTLGVSSSTDSLPFEKRHRQEF